MPGKIKVKILAGRNLPVMDRSGDTTDAYVELKFGNITYKTDVCRKSLNPQWNSEWYKFEVDDAELQDEPLQIRLMDHDTYSANDAIGKVYINLNPLLLPGMLPPVKNIWTLEATMNTSASSQGSVMTGWIPVYDTMHGIRGEVNIIIKVELFSDFNKFRQSSCGVQFFYSPNIPYGYHAQMIHGFVEELVVSDDPEYQWIDKIRTPRASNEARQTLFFKLSGEVQRKIGLKALDLGGNAVIGYLQNFDLEGESGIVARGIGTAVTLVKLHDVLGFPCDNANIEEQQDEAASSVSPSYPLPTVPSVAAKVSQSPANRTLANVPLHRRSSDSDLSITPKGNSLGNNDRSMAAPLRTPAAVVRSMNQDTLEMLEYPFITMQHYPPGFILHIGGLVSSRSVKLLERISNLEEPEGRDAWWTEIRMEVRSHARALACNVVIGYKEETSICDDVCVLSAFGTAAVINLHNSAQEPDSVALNKLQLNTATAASVDSDREKSQQKSTTMMKTEKADSDTPVANHSERQTSKACRHSSESNDHEGSCGQTQLRCNLCHLPYSEKSVPFRVNVSKCAICKRGRVPDVMFTTIEVPANIPTTGRGCFIQATVCKNKKDLRGELNAKEISDCLPFLEYELHSLLLNKLKMKGMNAIFGLKLQVSVGERLIIGMAVGTALYLTALPPPTIPQIASGNSWHNDEQLAEIQKSIVETAKKNREFYHLKSVGISEAESTRITSTSDTDDSDEDLPEFDLGLGTRDACVLEVDDIEDMDRISSLMDDRPPDDFHVVNTQTIPGLEDLEIVRNLQMFSQISRTKIPVGQSATMPSKFFARLLQSLCFKLRRMVPCALCDMQFRVALPEQDEIQVTVIGMALGLGEPLKTDRYKKKIVCRSLSKDQVRKSDDSDMIFSLDEDHVDTNIISDNPVRTCTGSSAVLNNISMQKPRPRSPLRSKTFTAHRHKYVPLKGRYGVDITPLSYLPGGRIERYQGNLNFFFIRESTSIRENGGLSGFTHSFVMEILAIVRAHITALGGNAMVAFSMTQCVLLHSPHKNQGQCLINVGGDVVTVSYYADEKHSVVSNC
ncbi:C2 domain-containing protein 5 isoform X1 [Harpegnathos saltator]|uniref:C2 domain-containing protein 5 isoform X1 n=1 Tax=Harpegnathos saltator TaxID=610380 RepID=UPI00058B7199|nr:C2 domain-containing protein 5 isoform X1 [Harpegnathos saltator]XP_025154353.1 C2 domain-containing protein 5 isoform X1 [Harpegnathos saltator]